MHRALWALLLAPALLPAEEGRPLVTVPLTLHGKAVFVGVQINGGRPLQFLFDSAAGWHCINRRIADDLHLKLREHASGAQGAGDGVTRAAEVIGAKIGLRDLQLDFTPAATIDLDNLAARRGEDLDGLLGAPLLQRYVVEVDQFAALLKVYDPTTWKYTGAGEALPVRVDSMGTPHVRVAFRVAGGAAIEGEFKIDSAASSSTLMFAAPFAAEKQLLQRLRAGGAQLVADEVAGVGGTSRVWYSRLAEVKVGKTTFPSPVAGITEATGGTLASSSIAGIIGGGFLHRFKMIYDCPHNRIYLEPGPGLDEPFEYDMSGLRWTSPREHRQRHLVRAVMPDTPAARAGLQPGDELTRLNGRAASEMDRGTLGAQLMAPGGKVRLTVKRGGRELNFELTLARLI